MPSAPVVALCSTCIVDQFLPEVGVAAVKVLRRAGCQVTFPAEQTCCGQPFFNSGFRQQAIKLATRTISIFEPYDAVVLPGGSCTAMIRLEYPHLLSGMPEWKDRALKLADKTFELSQYLVQELDWQPDEGTTAANLDKTVTYHDSCHMCRMLGLREEPRQLLESAGMSLREMSESDRCCGFGGLFSIRMPEVSNAMTGEKLVQARESGADVMVTADPGCLMQMRGLVQEGVPPIEHLATIMEEATR